ncbi:MAG: hypothetical protein AAF387_02710 [Pseudomonadota bacterium]
MIDMTAINFKNLALGTLLLGALSATQAANEGSEQQSGVRLKIDFIDAAYAKGLGGIAVVGAHGMVGTLKPEGDGWRLHALSNDVDDDFTTLGLYGDSQVLVGGSTGKLYSYDGSAITEITKLSEYDEPVLDISCVEGNCWAVGARGIVTKSSDGKTWEEVEIRDVTQPMMTFASSEVADWYFGVSNLDLDSLKFTGNVGGQPAVEDEHFIMYPDEGFVQFAVDFDPSPAPTVEFIFNPGPPFRVGDVSWNTVLYDGTTVTLAGEFGMVLQSTDGGESWIRRDGGVVKGEPTPAYWITGKQEGERMTLAGAAGVSALSTDGGKTWARQPRPGNEGIFGIDFLPNGQPIIAGAVGLIGTFDNGEWKLADRTALRLLSWLKNPVMLDDGTFLMLGGRSTAIAFKDGEWTRVPVLRD